MDIVRGAMRVVTDTANATTAAAGAVSGAAINGVVGGVLGTVGGIRNGLSAGSHSTPAAVLTLAAIGATGLVEWPVVLTIGGTTLLVHQLSQHSRGQAPKPAKATQQTASRTPPRNAAGKSTSSRRRTTSRRA